MSHKKVQCWIFSQDAKGFEYCLLLKTNKARGEFWQPVTGTVEDNEDFLEAARREPVEETGFTFKSEPLNTGYEFEFHSRFGQARECVFALVVDDIPPPRLDPREHQGFKWVSPKEALDQLRFPSNVEGLIQAYKLVFKKDLRKESQ